eukprot:829943-Amphidinium_carterae.1
MREACTQARRPLAEDGAESLDAPDKPPFIGRIKKRNLRYPRRYPRKKFALPAPLPAPLSTPVQKKRGITLVIDPPALP